MYHEALYCLPGTALLFASKLYQSLVFTSSLIVYMTFQTCQRNDWPKHREECAAHKRMRTMFKERYSQANATEDTRWVMREPLRALGRLFWARRRARRETTKDPIWVREVQAITHV